MKRISLLIKDEHYAALSEKDINISGLIRDLLDDYLSDFKITLSVTEPTRNMYDKIVSNTGSTDSDIEEYFRSSLKDLLRDRIESMQVLHSTLN